MEKHVSNSTKKFMFDINDFGEEALRKKREALRRPTFSQDEMEASRLTGYEQGHAAGLKEAINSQESQIRDLMQQIVIAADHLAQNENARLATFIDQATLLTAQALAKTAPALLDILSNEQIVAFVRNVFESQSKNQTLSIHVAPEREAEVKTRLEAIAKTMRRNGNWSIAADSTLNNLQCRIEWTGGGADWDPLVVSQTLLKTITAHLPESLQSLVTAGMDEKPAKPHNEDNASGDAS